MKKELNKILTEKNQEKELVKHLHNFCQECCHPLGCADELAFFIFL